MTSAAVPNLFAWTAQVAIVVAAAALAARLLHVDAAGARYTRWRLVLLVCLALPVLQPWQKSEVSPGSRASPPPGATRPHEA